MPVCQEKRPKILVIGSINMDMVARIDHIPLPGETVLGQGYSFAPGGKGANAAVAAARLGGCVAFAGCVGDDSYGQALRKTLTDEGVDDRLLESIDMVITDGQASISMLQRRMKIGYARAGRLIDDMAARGIVSKSVGSKPREVLISREEFEKIKDTLV